MNQSSLGAGSQSLSKSNSNNDREMDATTLLLPNDGESIASSRDVKFSRKGQKHWTRKVDWGLNGYFLFCIAAWLYFLQVKMNIRFKLPL